MSQFVSFLKIAKISSFTEVTEVLEIAEHFQPKFKSFYKRDPYDIFDFLIWGLHEECNRAKLRKSKMPSNVVIKEGDAKKYKIVEMDYITGEKEWALKKTLNDSYILDVFEGQLIIEMRCYYCGWPQNAFENFTSLSLPFPSDDEGEASLSDCINQYLSKYVAKEKKNIFFCDRCWKQTPYTKSVKFFKLP